MRPFFACGHCPGKNGLLFLIQAGADQWQGAGKRAAFAFYAGHADRATVRLEYALHDGQAQARAAPVRQPGVLDLIETFEDLLQLFGGDANALVDDLNRDGARRLTARQTDRDRRVRRRELDRVAEQVVDHLCQPIAIALNGIVARLGFVGESVATLAVDQPRAPDGLLSDFSEVHQTKLKRLAPDYFEREDVVDQAADRLGALVDHVQRCDLVRRHWADLAVSHQRRIAAHQRERAAQLVADILHQLIAQRIDRT